MSKAWDKILLIAMLTLLGLISALLGLGLSGKLAELAESVVKRTTNKPLVPLEAEVLTQRHAGWLTPQIWKEENNDHALFVGQKYYYFPSTNKVDLAKGELVVDGITLAFAEQHQLSISDANIGSRDPDGDGFTNLFEFQEKTNPREATSHPPYIKLLRMKNYVAQKFRLKFQSKSELDGQDVYQIATADGAKKVYFVKRDQTFEGFKVLEYRTKTKEPTAPDYVSDISELDILNEKTGQKVTLTIGRERDEPEVTVSFVLLIPGLVDKPVECKVGGEFSITLPLVGGQPSVVKQFKLLSAQAAEAMVVELPADTATAVPLMKADDLRLVAKPQ